MLSRNGWSIAGEVRRRRRRGFGWRRLARRFLGGPAHRRGVCFFLRSGSWGSSSVGRTNQRLLYVYTGQVVIASFVHLLANHMFVCYARALVGGEVEVFRVCVLAGWGVTLSPAAGSALPGVGPINSSPALCVATQSVYVLRPASIDACQYTELGLGLMFGASVVRSLVVPPHFSLNWSSLNVLCAFLRLKKDTQTHTHTWPHTYALIMYVV